MQEKKGLASSTKKASENLCWEVGRGGLLPAGSMRKILVEWVACKMGPGRKNRVQISVRKREGKGALSQADKIVYECGGGAWLGAQTTHAWGIANITLAKNKNKKNT